MSDTWTLQDEAATPYLNVCNYAANSDEFFKQFKSHPAYRHVLEHVSYEEGKEYLKEINIDYLDKLDEIKENDSLGSPATYEYPSVGEISPTTIRYIKNTSDIITKFGTSFNSIVEIGGGYGGLCKVLSSFIKFEQYLLLDLEECNLLSRKYLSHFDLPTLSYRSEEIDEIDENFDLLISNYAFSECHKEVQQDYIKRFIKKSNNFYIMHNNFHLELGTIPHEQFVEIMSDTHDVEWSNEHGIHDAPKIIYGTIK
tara:strand:+ start:341 stop:1105 length:765 start_codon:yes stop_codon:yes gene_type:complete